MKKNLLLVFFIACFFGKEGMAQTKTASQLIAGPMLGYVEHREVLIWMEVSSAVKKVQIEYYEKAAPQSTTKVDYKNELGKEFNPIKLELSGLKMNTTYVYKILLNDKKMDLPFATEFKTRDLWEWRKPAPDFSFLIGSCTYTNDSLYDRPGKPYGGSTEIFKSMATKPSEFMIWGGDNFYYREADYSSKWGMKYRCSHDFSIADLQALRASRANFAIWDDHDFGPDDSNTSWEFKEEALNLFKNYWGNRNFGEADNAGIYSKFSWSDAEFFLMDDRYHRSANQLKDSVNGKPNPEKYFYGRKQMDWLKNNLIASRSVFKFIVTGGQMLNPMADKECFRFYAAEYKELMDFIVENKISGIVFLSGDRHFSEMIKINMPNFYPLYEFTCSSLTSGIHNISNKPEFINPNRVANSLLLENNFGKISISGAKGARKITFETYSKSGEQKWKHEVGEGELKMN
jgi:alkaline phosphatase D